MLKVYRVKKSEDGFVSNVESFSPAEVGGYYNMRVHVNGEILRLESYIAASADKCILCYKV